MQQPNHKHIDSSTTTFQIGSRGACAYIDSTTTTRPVFSSPVKRHTCRDTDTTEIKKQHTTANHDAGWVGSKRGGDVAPVLICDGSRSCFGMMMSRMPNSSASCNSCSVKLKRGGNALPLGSLAPGLRSSSKNGCPMAYMRCRDQCKISTQKRKRAPVHWTPKTKRDARPRSVVQFVDWRISSILASHILTFRVCR